MNIQAGDLRATHFSFTVQKRFVGVNISLSLLMTFSSFPTFTCFVSSARVYPLLHEQMYEPTVLLHLC